MNIEKMLKEKSKLIDKEIEKVFPEAGLKNLNDAVWYHLSTGGKRIRPILALMVCEALGEDSRKALPFAASCEILHNWLLIHDDIEDGDKIRRNKPTVWVKYGIPHAINVGDYMAQKVFELILRSKNYGVDKKKILQLIDVMALTAVKTAEGQTMDINLRNNNNPTEKEYMNMVINKTGYYLTAPMIGGAIVADNEKIIEKIIDFGKCAGPAFQIIDDVLDLTVGKGRLEIGRDIKEGKRSILVVHCLSKCTKNERKKLLSILNKPAEKTIDMDILYAKRLFEKYGSIDYARSKANNLIKKAKSVTKDLPPELRSVLNSFADYLIERKK